MRKSEQRFCEVLRIRCTFSLKIQFYIIYGLIWAQILRYFLHFRKCAYESLLQHCNILRKREQRFCEVLRFRCTFSLNIQFFISYGLSLEPDFEIFSQFQEMLFWINSSASLYRAKKRTTVLWSFAYPIHLFIKDSILHNLWPNFGPRFWDIFSISGNALMNHIIQHCNILRKREQRFSEVLHIRCTFSLKIQFFIIYGLTLGPDFEIFSPFQEMRLWITSSAL